MLIPDFIEGYGIRCLGGFSKKMYQAFSSGFYMCSVTTSLHEVLIEVSKIVVCKLVHIIKYESRLDQII
jgi:hypothetical protein